jgi:hypothetical protein
MRDMSATKLNVRWMEAATGEKLPIHTDRSDLFTRLGVEPAERRCPSCNSLVYTRRHKVCGACGRTLPESCLFTSDEAERIDQLLRRERQRHRQWLKKVAAA